MCQGKAKAKRVRRHINRMQDHYHSEKVTCRKCDGGRYKGIARGTESMDKHWQTSAEETPDSDPSPGPQRKRGEIKDVCRACGATSHTITKHVSALKPRCGRRPTSRLKHLKQKIGSTPAIEGKQATGRRGHVSHPRGQFQATPGQASV